MMDQIQDQDIILIIVDIAAIQSRRVFRYQPGRISGFTFGLRSSTEPVSGSCFRMGNCK